MANILQQGTLNKLRASAVFADYPELNVISGNLAKGAISIEFTGDTAQLLPTLTGGVPSPEPYQIATVTMHLLRSQSLADTYKNQIESSSVLGSMNVIPDSSVLGNYQIENCVVKTTTGLGFDASSPDFTVTLSGIYYINSALFA